MRNVWVVILIMSLLFSCSGSGNSDRVAAEVLTDSVPLADTLKEDSVKHAVFMAVGDIMVHRWQMQKAFDKKDSSFNFSGSFKYIKPFFDDADFVLGNLETTFAGKNKGRQNKVFGYSCFPYFNAPEEMASALKEAGFDLLSTANNHSLDSKFEGLCSTLNVLDSVGLHHLGTYRSQAENDSVRIFDINGIKTGFLACTYSLNGNTLKSEVAFSIDEFRRYDKGKLERLCGKIRRLKEAGAEFVIVLTHFGTEYQHEPNAKQKMAARMFAEAGADVIVGSHPHILQRIDYDSVTVDGKVKKVLVAYSLGNFISSQVQRGSLLKDVGAVMRFSVRKDSCGVALDGLKVLPTYSYWKYKEIGVVPLIAACNRPEDFRFLRKKSLMCIKTSYKQTFDVLSASFKDRCEVDSVAGWMELRLE